MNALEARAALFKREIQEFPLDISLPGLMELDNQLSVLELSVDDINKAHKMAIGPDGEVDDGIATGAMVAKALVMRDTKERVFSDNDAEGIACFGMLVLKPLSDLVVQASGLDPEALANAKKNLKPITANVSNTSLPANSEVALPAQS